MSKKKKGCKYCSGAFTDIYEEDDDSKRLLEFYIPIFDTEIYMNVQITELGEIAFWAQESFYGRKKIKYCPMCGVEIPKITPTQAHKRGGKEDV